MHLCNWHTLAAWRATSRQLFKVVAALLRRRYEAYVKLFVHDRNVAILDDALRDKRAIIAGSIALHFFLPDPSWSPVTLDIYVPAGTYRSFLSVVGDPAGLNWRRLRRRYQPGRIFSPLIVDDDNHGLGGDVHADIGRISHEPGGHSSDEDERNSDNNYSAIDDPPLRDMHSVRRCFPIFGSGCRAMTRMLAPNGRIIRVMCSSTNNPIAPIRESFSTLIMNFLTPDACVCGFPSITFRRSGLLRYYRWSQRDQSYRRLYQERGFLFEGDDLHNTLDPWHMSFFGERTILAVDFRHDITGPVHKLPIKDTDRGWVSNSGWRGWYE